MGFEEKLFSSHCSAQYNMRGNAPRGPQQVLKYGLQRPFKGKFEAVLKRAWKSG
jgi:hypothetical protein